MTHFQIVGLDQSFGKVDETILYYGMKSTLMVILFALKYRDDLPVLSFPLHLGTDITK